MSRRDYSTIFMALAVLAGTALFSSAVPAQDTSSGAQRRYPARTAARNESVASRDASDSRNSSAGTAAPQHRPFMPGVPQPRRPQPSWGLPRTEEQAAQQEAALQLVLQAWEKKSGAVKTLACDFTMFEYDPVFGGQKGRQANQAGQRDPNAPTRTARGELRYAAPDKGHFHVTQELDDSGKFVAKEGEFWVCDGDAVYEFNHLQQQLIERRLPEELKGKAISNGPLPFLFGTTADQMRRRYWMRITTRPDVVGKEIWLEAEPIYREDRANYQRAHVILDEAGMLPLALQLELPSGRRVSYAFQNYSINSLWKEFRGYFKVPALPRGWKHIVEEPPAHVESATRAVVPPPDLHTLRIEPPKKRK